MTKSDLQTIYGRPNDLRFVQVGHLASSSSIPALVEIDKLVTRHSAVVGTTGSGKSTTVAGILTALSESQHYPSAQILVIDIHGEYGRALEDRAAIFRTNPDPRKNERPLFIPYWAMTLDELLPVTVGAIENPADRGALIDKISELKLESIRNAKMLGVSNDSLSVDTPVPFCIHKLWFDLHCEMRATHYEKPGQPQSRGTWALEIGVMENPFNRETSYVEFHRGFDRPRTTRMIPKRLRLSRSNLGMSRALDALGSKFEILGLTFSFALGRICLTLREKFRRTWMRCLQTGLGTQAQLRF